jgi:methionyl-tRNA formyltransferase
MRKKTKVVVLCCPGLYQKSLAARISEEFELVGLIRQSSPNSKGSLLERISRVITPVGFFRYLQARKCILQQETKAKPLVEKLFYMDGHPPNWPNVPTMDTADVNENRVVQFVKDSAPDLICINGTNLLRQPILEIIPFLRLGALNMHTGLSPYSRGGNCSLFMLLERHPEMVGVTIHHIDPGIDSGDIILSSRPELEESDNFEMIEAKVFRLGIDLMILAIHQLTEGKALRVKQWEKGKLFLRKTGYVYHPYLRVQVNELIKRGLIRHYLCNRETQERGIKLIGETVNANTFPAAKQK